MADPNDSASNPKGLSASKRKLLEQRLRGKSGPAGSVPETIPVIPVEGPRPAAPGQQWIFVAQESVPASAGFNISSSFEVRGEIDPDRLESCLNAVVQRHEVLKSHYRMGETGVEMLIDKDFVLTLDRIQCRDDADLDSRSRACAQKPLAMKTGPLLRVHLLTEPEGKAILMLVIHDIIFDKWSLGLFWKETAALYRESMTGRPSGLPNLEIQYGDFARWQQDQLASGRHEQQLDYWKRQLSDLPGPLSLTTDRPYPARLTDRGRLERHRIGSELTRKLKDFAADRNASLFMVTLLAWQILLSRSSGTSDIVVASPVANRRRRETAALIGFFLSTVALRSRFDDDPSVDAALDRLRTASLEAIEHQDVPFNRVVEAVRPPRIAGRHPLCQVMFVYQREDEAAPSFSLGETEMRHIYVETETSKFDATLFAAESGDAMEVILEYRTDLFDQATSRHLLRRYEKILSAMVEAPGSAISQINWLPSDEQSQLLRDWQGAPPIRDRPPMVTDEIMARVQARPDDLAVTSSQGQMTYRDLERVSRRIAEQLQDHGIGPGSNVAHLMDRGAAAVAAVLGILRSGAAYVPIDPVYPEARKELIIRDAGIQVCVTDLAAARDAAGIRDFIVVDPQLQATGPGEKSPLPAVAPEQPAYLIYTSGSTGRPKGVVVTHRNLAHSTAARSEVYERPPERFLLIPSFSFDSSIAGIFWTLARGGTLVVPTANELRDPQQLRNVIRDREVTDLLGVPTLYREVLRDADTALETLKRVIVAGESCPPDLVTKHYARLPAAEMYNEYGPTEATVWATVHSCTPEDGEVTGSVSIGRPIPGMKSFVLDPKGRPQPTGTPGELYLGGPGVTLGYWNQPELTAERFRQHRLPLVGAIRLYRTGDLVRWQNGGTLEFLGRTDQQLKVRGYRIEAGEIEAALKQHPSVDDAVVVIGGNAPQSVNPDARAILGSIPESLLLERLATIESMSPAAVRDALDQPRGTGSRTPDRIVDRDRFTVELHTKTEDFAATPRAAQRKWMISQAMEEIADDLAFIDQVAPTLVKGHDHQLANELKDITQSSLTDQEIMEDWQTPLMKAMARSVTESHGDILEIGFGRGVSAEFIQKQGVRSHTVVEMNRHSVDQHFVPWRKRHSSSDIRLVEGRWQEVLDQLGLYDGIFFHAFPLNEEEFTRYVLESITFAEHAFEPMADLLRPGGSFTYLTTEINSLSRRHQRRLFRHFRSISIQVEKLSIPSDTRDTWWADKMVVIRAVK